jgi:hypothetical protein
MNRAGQGQYASVARRHWGQRLVQAIVGMVGGAVLILVAIGGLWWNEGRALDNARGLGEGAAQVVSIDSERPDPVHNGRLVHVSGLAVSEDVLTDPMLGIEENAIALLREVEMFQWHERSRSETRTSIGGGEERVTTYSYWPDWSARHIDSSGFHLAGDHRNPSGFPISAETRRADNVAIGNLRLNAALIRQIGDGRPLALNDQHVAALPPRWRERADADQAGWLYLGDALMPEIGDMRIRVSVVRDQPVSLLARQLDNTFEPYVTSQGTVIERLMSGSLSAGAMFEQMERENVILTWGIRVGGLVAMVIGFGLVLAPIRVAFDVLPLLGSLAGAGVGLVSGLLGSLLSLLVIAAAWLFHRPLISVVLLALCAGLAWWVSQRVAVDRSGSPGGTRVPEEAVSDQ